ncbi:MAG: PAS domain S-box protein [Chloroflexi bacterium]|nr:PAS domain S-box protein [Chloroflexota bacterium]
MLVQTAAALEQSEATQRAILKAIPDLMFRLGCEGDFLDFNVPQVTDFIAAPEKLLGKKLPEVLPPEVAQQVMVAIEQVCQTGEMYIIESQLPLQGEVNHYESRLVRSKEDEVLIIVRNITERKRAEAALRQSEERYRQATEQSPNAIFFVNQAGLIQKWNQACINLFQYGLEIIGQSYQKLLWSLEDRTVVESLVAQVFEKQSFTGVEISYRCQDGGRRFTVSRLYPIFDLEGNVQECVFSNTDVTNEKQAEEALRLQNEQLQARNRELDAFARTVAHDLKNPLGVLTPMAEILLEDYRYMPRKKLGEYLEAIARSGRRASRIVEALLLLAGVRQKNVKVEPLDMAAIIGETLQRLEPMITEYRAEIITPATWPVVLGYGPWVEEVWINYLSNGLKYGGRPPHLEMGATSQPDGMVRFWLRDNGPGLTLEAQAQLFTEFTQLEPDRMEGHGLGLSIVRRIVEKLGGQVGVESEGQPGRGSIFSFTLPWANP